MGEHSIYGFSGAHRWEGDACPGSVTLCQGIPDTPTEYSMEGDAAHYLAAQILDAWKMSGDIETGHQVGLSMVGSPAPNGVMIDEEMYDACVGYSMAIFDVVGTDVDNLLIEHRVHAPSIHPAAWGTMDAGYYRASTNTKFVWDLKYGFYGVTAFENMQLVGYGQAAVETMTERGVIVSDNPRLDLNIYQPRCYDGNPTLRTWVTSYHNIRPLVNRLRHGIGLIEAGNAKLRAGPWCRDCVGIAQCPAIQQAAALAFDIIRDPIAVSDRTPAALAYEKSILDRAEELITQRKTAVDVMITQKITQGEFVPGYRLEPRMGQRKWVGGDDTVLSLGDLFGLSFAAPAKPVSPAQADRLMKSKGFDESVIKEYYETPRIGTKLVSDDINRARQLFSQENNNG